MIRITLISLIVALVSGCGHPGMQDLHDYLRQVDSRPAGKIAPLPEVKPCETFVYQAQDLRSPFISGQIIIDKSLEAKPECSHPDFSRPKEPLENVPLDSLKYVGSIVLKKQMYGLLRDADGIVHRIKRGARIGTNHGRILSVSSDKIELIEVVPDGRGCWMERPVTVSLHDT